MQNNALMDVRFPQKMVKMSKFEISSSNPKTALEKVSENGLTSNFTIWDV